MNARQQIHVQVVSVKGRSFEDPFCKQQNNDLTPRKYTDNIDDDDYSAHFIAYYQVHLEI